MKKKRIVQYIFHYGDQHANKGIKTICDGGSNIHVHLIKKLEEKFKIAVSTYKDNYLFANFFTHSKNVTIKEFFTFSGLFKRNLLWYELWWRCLFPGLIFLLKRVDGDYLITKTEFLPDTITALFIKIRNPQIIWVASYFLDPPKPWDKNSPYQGKRWFIGFFYWLLQIPSYLIIKKMADFVLVTSEPDVKKFITKKRDESKIIVVQGGVDIKPSKEYLNSGKVIPLEKRKYAACFVGRFHPQKGVLELVDIWKLVCAGKPGFKLAMIGIGSLEKEVQEKIEKYRLQDNIELLGFKDGEEKYEIFKQSKIVVHPATYDSGGMAACEAMAWGLPGVSFDLEALKTYYPKGMLKTPCYDLEKFAESIISLLEDKELYERTAKEAIAWAREWDWDKRVELFLNKAKIKLFNNAT